MSHLTKFSFGGASAVITSLAFIVGLSTVANNKMIIISSLLVFAIADNISDSLGFHIYQESDLKRPRTVATSTFFNFVTRLVVIGVFILFVALLPTEIFMILSILWGLALLSLLSIEIAKEQKMDPIMTALRHISIAVLVILASFLLRAYITGFFTSF